MGNILAPVQLQFLRQWALSPPENPEEGFAEKAIGLLLDDIQEREKMAECGHCATCKWWGKPLLGGRSGWRVCSRATPEDGIPIPDPALMVPSDESGYRAYLETAPIFGCVQWEAK